MCVDQTRHATIRGQQRAIPPFIQSVLLDHGSRMHRHGAEVVFLDKAARKRLGREFGGDRGGRTVERMLEPWLNTYLVVAENDRVVTAARRIRRLKRL